MYNVEYVPSVADDLAQVRAHERRGLLDRIEEQLAHEPSRQTRNRKILIGLVPPWEHAEPVWELRIGEFRVFYDVEETEQVVVVRAIRRKRPHKTTEEIL